MATVFFQNAAVIDGSGGSVAGADVLVDGNRIAAIGPAGTIAARADALAIDCTGKTLMPGMIEPHAHLSFLDQATPHAFSAMPPEEHLLATLKHARIYIDQGFTGAFSAAATKPRLDVVVRNAINAGDHPGPRLLACSVQLTVTGGLGDLRELHLDPGDAMYTRPCDGPIEFRRAAREACRDGVDVIKVNPSGDTSTPAVPSGRTVMAEDEMAAVAEVARQHGRRLAAHARSAESVKMCLRHGVEVIYHATYADEDAKDQLEAARDRIFVAPAIAVTYTRLHEFPFPTTEAVKSRIRRDLDATIACMQDLKKRGVRVLPGGDYGFQWNPHGRNARDLDYFVRLMGWTPMEAIVGATGLGGAIMGMGDQLGQVRTGYLADLLLVDGDPLKDVTILQDRARLLAIMKDGRFHKDPPAALQRRRREAA